MAPLPSKFVPFFSRKRRHTLLYGLQTFNMGETDINRADVVNSLNEGSDTRNKNVQNYVPSFIKKKIVNLKQLEANNTRVQFPLH